MKKLLFLVIIPLSLIGMESPFDNFKIKVDDTITKCTKIEYCTKRFEQFKQDYKKLYNLLPNKIEHLESLIQEANCQEYNDPIGRFLLLWKHKEITDNSKKQSTLSKWFSSSSQQPNPKNGETPTPMPAATNEEFEKLVIDAAENYQFILPFTEFAQHLWNNRVYTEFSKFYGNTTIKLSKKVNAIDLYYLSFSSDNLNQIYHGDFNKLELKLTMVPEDVSKLKNLRELNLDENNLSDLPASLARLKNLNVLCLENNKFTQLPKAIAQLKALLILTAQNNQLQEDPHELISQLPNLSDLNLSNNQLTSFEPKEFPPSLKKLNLANNQIKKLPSIPKSSLLQHLNVASNPLEESPYHLIKSNYHLKELIDEDGNTIEIKRS